MSICHAKSDEILRFLSPLQQFSFDKSSFWKQTIFQNTTAYLKILGMRPFFRLTYLGNTRYISLSNLRWVRICSESVHTFSSLIFGSLKLVGNGSFLFTRSTHIGDFDLCRRRAPETTSVQSYSSKPGHHREDFEIHKGFPLYTQ